MVFFLEDLQARHRSKSSQEGTDSSSQQCNGVGNVVGRHLSTVLLNFCTSHELSYCQFFFQVVFSRTLGLQATFIKIMPSPEQRADVFAVYQKNNVSCWSKVHVYLFIAHEKGVRKSNLANSLSAAYTWLAVSWSYCRINVSMKLMLSAVLL